MILVSEVRILLRKYLPKVKKKLIENTQEMNFFVIRLH
ncbi:hypothetical protein SAMN06296036_10552 [Pseudobacteriovorax antillogorgiicola]|uniref:Uncharacterized protein n=1 Tax=Pseudobacteriovorax antillogorgiicola TaxID=1513793 RepID=A0A1Y6BMA4_9BACT|nr:hypothetical protein EDD56_105272 [Pseudobacteriovorax antillogorgiicola]SMF11085.1 hypothetical protein SAMN06296036_10552 [Pseudobacteriovorax antillogorgiicola]